MTSISSWVKKVYRTVGKLGEQEKVPENQTSSRFASSKIYCNDKFLKTFQLANWNMHPDSKTFVDLPLRDDPDKVIRRFKKLGRNPPEYMAKRFLKQNFFPSPTNETQIVKWIPRDYTSDPPSFTEKMFPKNHPAFIISHEIKRRWKDLCYKFIGLNGCSNPIDPWESSPRSSLIVLPHPFIVPGGRFREAYYWDTLWIVKGLISCDMITTAIGIVRNCLHLVQELGFVPAGNRVYYLNRSQPPILSMAVYEIFCSLETENEKFFWALECLPILEKELEFFSRNRSYDSKYAPLVSHKVQAANPRPEAYREDFRTAENAKFQKFSTKKSEVYSELASAAESGWAFSSRWCGNTSIGLSSIKTSSIIPVCLNSILLRGERIIAELYAYTSKNLLHPGEIELHSSKAINYAELAHRRAAKMNEVLWNSRRAIWMDYDCDADSHTDVISCAGIFPLLGDSHESFWKNEDAAYFVDSLKNNSGLLLPGGLACTKQVMSSEQWDGPNMWLPLVDMAVEGLRRLGKIFPNCGANNLAKVISIRSIKSVYRGWLRNGEFHEKYNAAIPDGIYGTGGEYLPQVGFAWTNGATIGLIRTYARELAHEFN